MYTIQNPFISHLYGTHINVMFWFIEPNWGTGAPLSMQNSNLILASIQLAPLPQPCLTDTLTYVSQCSISDLWVTKNTLSIVKSKLPYQKKKIG